MWSSSTMGKKGNEGGPKRTPKRPANTATALSELDWHAQHLP